MLMQNKYGAVLDVWTFFIEFGSICIVFVPGTDLFRARTRKPPLNSPMMLIYYAHEVEM